MSQAPNHLRYTKEHEWVEDKGNQRIRFGITDYAQSALGDIVSVQLPKVGELIESGKVCGEVESTKSVSEIFAPVSGKIVEINQSLDTNPETINADPYGSGWIAEVEVSSEPTDLLSAGDYQNLTA
jgi:glycine cleavage system H protein